MSTCGRIGGTSAKFIKGRGGGEPEVKSGRWGKKVRRGKKKTNLDTPGGKKKKSA